MAILPLVCLGFCYIVKTSDLQSKRVNHYGVGSGCKTRKGSGTCEKTGKQENGHGTERAGERNERRTNNAGRMEKKRAITNRTGVVGLEEATGSPLIASIMLTTASMLIGTKKIDREKCKFSGGDRLSVFLA